MPPYDKGNEISSIEPKSSGIHTPVSAMSGCGTAKPSEAIPSLYASKPCNDTVPKRSRIRRDVKVAEFVLETVVP